MSYGLI